MIIFKRLVYYIIKRAITIYNFIEEEKLKKKYQIHASVRLANVDLIGPYIYIDKYTYINPHSLVKSGINSIVKIGKHCAIGRNVHINASSHDFIFPTTSDKSFEISHHDKDITIGNYVWIGDNVFIKEGVKIGDYAVIGANSVVTRDVFDFEIVAGVPARHIRYNTRHMMYR